MPTAGRHDEFGAPSTYLPTSLDFLTRPNPVEPNALRDKHFWNGPAQLNEHGVQNSQGPFGHILHTSPLIEDAPAHGTHGKLEQTSRRRKAENDSSLDLPKLPERRSLKRARPRLPPTISGLHQPPPDAGLLPRINIEAPPHAQQGRDDVGTGIPSSKIEDSARITTHAEKSRDAAESTRDSTALVQPHKRNKWSEEETAQLQKGVAMFGIGSWTKILRHPEFRFHRRTALDLKDKFRVLRPDQYRNPEQFRTRQDLESGTRSSSNTRNDADITQYSAAAATSHTQKIPEPLSSQGLQEFDMDCLVDKKQRRSRHGYNEIEDDALLRGFQKYGTKWKKIHDDPELGLSHRQPTDLRDRMRTKFPEQYAKSGRASAVKISDAARRPKVKAPASNLEHKEARSTIQSESSKAIAPISKESKENGDSLRPPQPKSVKSTALPTRPNLQPLYDSFPPSDVFFGASFDAEMHDDNQLITLDRDILSFANIDTSEKPAASLPEPSRSELGAIDPQETLLGTGLPRQAYGSLTNASGGGAAFANATSLPSFATLMPSLSGEMRDDADQQIDLPSMQWHDSEIRSQQNIPSLDELG